MPIDPKAIENFFAREPPRLPEFKGAKPEKLQHLIYSCTGATFRPKTEPRQHQLEGLAMALYLRQSLMFFDMRTGKTKLALDWAAHMRRANLWHGPGLVIAHSPLGLSIWEDQAQQHSDLRLQAVRKSADEFVSALESNCDLIAVPWTGLQALFSVKRRNRKGVMQRYADKETIKIAAGAFELCIIDEIHRCADPHGLWFNITHPLVRECKFRLGLTGTPIGRNPFKVWTQTALIDDGRTLGYSYGFFEQAFGKSSLGFFSGHKEWKFDKKKLPLLNAHLARISMSYTRKEIRDIEVLRGVVRVPMGSEQRAAYNAMIDRLISFKRGETTEMENTFIRSRQIASGWRPFVDADGEERIVEFHDVPKLEWIEELVTSLPPDIQVIIFHEFTHSGELLCRRMQKAKIKHSWLHGATKNKPEAVRAFQERRVQVMIANTATGSLGIDLVGADYLCFFESTCSPIVRAQAEARPLADARGQRALMLDDLVACPAELRILDFLREGKDMMSQLITARKSLKA